MEADSEMNSEIDENENLPAIADPLYESLEPEEDN